MADDVDLVTELSLVRDAAIHKHRYNIPKGVAGECEDCGKHSPRLINGLCACCRDGRA